MDGPSPKKGADAPTKTNNSKATNREPKKNQQSNKIINQALYGLSTLPT